MSGITVDEIRASLIDNIDEINNPSEMPCSRGSMKNALQKGKQMKLPDVLVLNKGFIPIHIIEWQRCMSLIAQGAARALDNDFVSYEFERFSTIDAFPQSVNGLLIIFLRTTTNSTTKT